MAVVETSAPAPVLDWFTNRDRTTVVPNTYGAAPDEAALAEYNQAQADWQKQYDAIGEQAKALQAKFDSGEINIFALHDGAAALKAQADQLNTHKPNPQDYQQKADRYRQIQQAAATYQPLIDHLTAIETGQAPSTALIAYRAAADDAARRNYGVAASSLGTGGQRAALFQAALGQEALDRQKATTKAAEIASEEQARARQGLIAAAAGQAQVYENLLNNTTHTQDANQNAENLADAANKATAQHNAAGAANAFNKVASTAGTLAEAYATGGTSLAADAALSGGSDTYGGDTTDYIPATIGVEGSHGVTGSSNRAKLYTQLGQENP